MLLFLESIGQGTRGSCLSVSSSPLGCLSSQAVAKPYLEGNYRVRWRGREWGCQMVWIQWWVCGFMSQPSLLPSGSVLGALICLTGIMFNFSLIKECMLLVLESIGQGTRGSCLSVSSTPPRLLIFPSRCKALLREKLSSMSGGGEERGRMLVGVDSLVGSCHSLHSYLKLQLQGP